MDRIKIFARGLLGRIGPGRGRWEFGFPPLETLSIGLNSILNEGGFVEGDVSIIQRKPSIRTGTYPSEIVSCRFPNGSEHRFFCKYQAGRIHHANGHRGGLTHEAAVFEKVLKPTGFSTPTFYGVNTAPETNEPWLVVEYLRKRNHLGYRYGRSAMIQAAEWIGKFHAFYDDPQNEPRVSFLPTYDESYYNLWVDRTSEFIAPMRDHVPWLPRLGSRFLKEVPLLLGSSLTIIHGEYYPNNILVHDRIISPVDWESAAIAAGEIDIASMTEGRWKANLVHNCEQAYAHCRWSEGAVPANFIQRILCARIYLHFRWLGDRAEWTTGKQGTDRLKELRSLGERMKWI